MTRLDAALAARGLARSRSHAATLIADGLVRVDGRPVVKASTPVGDEAEIVVDGGDHYVSRGAHKLVAELMAVDQPTIADRAIQHLQLGSIRDPGSGFGHGGTSERSVHTGVGRPAGPSEKDSTNRGAPPSGRGPWYSCLPRDLVVIS